MNIPREKRAAIEARINELAKLNGGRITPETVMRDAEDPTSPLHDSFEWDDEVAAYQHRLDQARALIRSVRIVVTTDTTVVKSVAYIRDPDMDEQEQGYVSVEVLKRSKRKAREAVRYEAERAYSAMQRARDVASALGLDDAVDAVIEDLEHLQERVAA